MQGIAGEELGVFAWALLREACVEGVGFLIPDDIVSVLFGVEGEAASRLDGFGHRQIGGPFDAAGTLNFAAHLDETFGDAHRYVDGAVEVTLDVGRPDQGGEFGRCQPLSL